ncbi:MAG: (2Fe-2S) ferredoxin domain-containing protein [Verrucomicrobiales bacterium]|nr:(2Fe-2S) ferredoxin domain-containing protein [Verrucomicrobiales bacterium]
MDPQRHELAAHAAIPLGIGRPARHIFLCCDATEAKCCDRAASLAAWEHLKRRLKERGLSGTSAPVAIHRSKAACLRICTAGPIAVVYPEGVWYHSCTPEVLDLIVDQHLVGGRIVEEYAFARMPSTPATRSSEASPEAVPVPPEP